MKKNIKYSFNTKYIYSLLIISCLSFWGCQKKLEDAFVDPERSSQANVEGMFTAMLNNNRVVPVYWNVRTFLCQMPGVYAQTCYFANSNTSYQQSDGYAGEYWEDFYSPSGNGGGVMALYKAIQITYAKSPVETQNPILKASKIVLIEQAIKMVDLWGDIPFSETASLQESSTIKLPKFDEQKTLYNTFISDLTDLAAYFRTATTNSTFSRADILLKGDVKNWERYANSLKLRLLMRISKVDETTAKTQIMQMLTNPANYPLIDGDNIADYTPKSSDVLLQPLTNYNLTLKDAFLEGSWYATDYMLNTLMKPANDPRIPVLYDKYGRTTNKIFTQNTDYAAMPITLTATEQETKYQDYAVLDSATFLLNKNLPGILFTATETNLIKAEAFERWGSTSDAKTAYDMALQQSVTFYYHLNNTNTSGEGKVEKKPKQDDIDKWINTSSIAYTGSSNDKLKLINIQKWAHLGILQSIEAWSEFRRTGFPVLTFPSAGKLAGYETPPIRLLYPAKEKTMNNQNYQAVQSKDTRQTKIFWIP